MSEEKLIEHTFNRNSGSYELLRRSYQNKPVSSRRKSGASSWVGISGKLIDRTLGYRHEIKYAISESKAKAIERFVEPYLGLDHYSKLQPGGAYPIVSLYLDSVDLRLCQESLCGHKNRFKLRVRSYTDEPDYPRFFEIKRRVNTIIIKSRARVKYQDIATLLSGFSIPPQHYKDDENILKQFQLYMNSINAEPVVRVRYKRRAYEGDSENRVRVTFDRGLCYNVGSTADVSFGGPGWQHLSIIEGVILEIKFTGRYPAWLSQMVNCFNLRQRSISKYVTSVKKACLLRFCAPKIPG